VAKFSKLIASVGGLGYIPFASGTLGSLVGVLFFFLFGHWPLLFLVLTAAVTGLSFYIVPFAQKEFGGEDDPRIVIDEVAGQMLTLLFLPVSWSFIVWGFILFRFFDIFKPYPIGHIDNNWQTPGVTADDLAAGLYALFILHVFKFIF